MNINEILHIIRNPWGWSEEEVRQARIAAADMIEQQAEEIEAMRKSQLQNITKTQQKKVKRCCVITKTR